MMSMASKKSSSRAGMGVMSATMMARMASGIMSSPKLSAAAKPSRPPLLVDLPLMGFGIAARACSAMLICEFVLSRARWGPKGLALFGYRCSRVGVVLGMRGGPSVEGSGWGGKGYGQWRNLLGL